MNSTHCGAWWPQSRATKPSPICPSNAFLFFHLKRAKKPELVRCLFKTKRDDRTQNRESIETRRRCGDLRCNRVPQRLDASKPPSNIMIKYITTYNESYSFAKPMHNDYDLKQEQLNKSSLMSSKKFLEGILEIFNRHVVSYRCWINHRQCVNFVL